LNQTIMEIMITTALEVRVVQICTQIVKLQSTNKYTQFHRTDVLPNLNTQLTLFSQRAERIISHSMEFLTLSSPVRLPTFSQY